MFTPLHLALLIVFAFDLFLMARSPKNVVTIVLTTIVLASVLWANLNPVLSVQVIHSLTHVPMK